MLVHRSSPIVTLFCGDVREKLSVILIASSVLLLWPDISSKVFDPFEVLLIDQPGLPELHPLMLEKAPDPVYATVAAIADDPPSISAVSATAIDAPPILVDMSPSLFGIL